VWLCGVLCVGNPRRPRIRFRLTPVGGSRASGGTAEHALDPSAHNRVCSSHSSSAVLRDSQRPGALARPGVCGHPCGSCCWPPTIALPCPHVVSGACALGGLGVTGRAACDWPASHCPRAASVLEPSSLNGSRASGGKLTGGAVGGRERRGSGGGGQAGRKPSRAPRLALCHVRRQFRGGGGGVGAACPLAASNWCDGSRRTVSAPTSFVL